MLGLFRCVGQAVLAKGLRGLLGEIPFVSSLLDVAGDAWERWRAQRQVAEMRVELQEVAQQVAVEEVRRVAVQVSEEVAADQPPPVQQALALYLSLLPASVRQSLKRPDDPSGTTVPPALRLEGPEDLLLRLPVGPPRFQPGARPAALGGWELVELLGVGGFGEVWLARNVSFPDMRAAVKFCLDASARERFLYHEGKQVRRVMQVQSRLTLGAQGDGIVPLQDANLETDPPWLRYEYIEGHDLSGLVRNWAGLSGPERARGATLMVRRLAAFVGQFHRLPEPIVHRDLKPANILVSRAPDGKQSLRICDFGISQVAARQAIEATRRSTPSMSVAPTLRGAHTPLYASPQQKLMKDPDVRDDVFALGVIWYQLLLGDLTLERPAGRWRKRVAGLGVDEALLDLLEACIDDDPQERPADATELSDRLPLPVPANRTVTTAPPSVGMPPTSKPSAEEIPRLLIAKRGTVLTLPISTNIDMKFAWMPAGAFLMGGTQNDEKPVHRVTIGKGFYMGVFPVTQIQWQAVMSYNPSQFRGDDRPVEEVSWEDCQDFCRKLCQLTSKPIRLPTEAEWEYACRAGTASEYFNGSDEAALREAGWFSGNSNHQTQPVGKLAPNPWGLYDVHGNVWEWCQDWYGPYTAENEKDPKGANSGQSRVLRGGSWHNGPCRAAHRSGSAPATRLNRYGCRVCFFLD